MDTPFCSRMNTLMENLQPQHLVLFVCLLFLIICFFKSRQQHQRKCSFDFTSLPKELKQEIFIRLPSKTLHICKCVSKQWYSMITCPEFTHSHQFRSLSSPSYPNRLVVFNIDNRLSSFELDAGNGATFPISEQVIPKPIGGTLFRPYTFVGLCNSLVCIAMGLLPLVGLFEKHLVVYNPFTRRAVRRVSLQNPGSGIYGFGYDAATDDYKIVRGDCSIENLTIGSGRFKPLFQGETKVFSLRAGVWKQVDDFSYTNIFRSHHRPMCAKFVHGHLRWFLIKYDNSNGPTTFDTLIVRFGLHCNKYTLMILPIELSKEAARCETLQGPGYAALDVFEGSLCLQVMSKNWQFDVWVMKEYGVSDSWTRLFRIEDIRYHLGMTKAVAYSTARDRILITRGHDFYWYDTEGNELGCVRFDKHSQDGMFSTLLRPTPGKGSLVCPFF